MKSQVLTHAVIGAVLSLSTVAAHAQSVTYNFDYIAQAQAAATTLPGASIASLSATATPVGSITFTDLADLNLGDGKTGVRISTTLSGLDQFSSGTGTRYSNSLEFSFPGTGAGTGGNEYVTSTNSLRNVSGAQFTTGGDGGIEWDEHGSVGAGTTNAANSNKWAFFQQQNNFVVGSFQSGNITFDYLNGDTLSGGANAGDAFNGFSVSNMVSVANQNTAAGLPNAFAWLRVRSTDGGIQKTGQWFDPYLNNATSATTGITTQTLNFLAVQAVPQIAAVPEPETYAMMLAGLGLIGFSARRRKTA